MSEINDAIYWWENELTDVQRDNFIQGDLWSGSVDQRNERLLGFYRRRFDSK